jgi:hypothetical protein
MIKLKQILNINEIDLQSGEWWPSYITDISNDIIPNYNVNKKYKGYRFIIKRIHENLNYLFMVLPDRNFIIGLIKFVLDDAKKYYININKPIAKVKESVIHTRFRHKGLGKIMYEYLANTYKIIMSDYTLFEGSYALWASMGEKFPGTLFAYDDYSDVYFIYTPEYDDAVSYFLFFYNDTYIKEHPKMMNDKYWIIDHNINPDKIIYYTYDNNFDNFKNEWKQLDYSVNNDIKDYELIIVYGVDFRAKVLQNSGNLTLNISKSIDPNQLTLFKLKK